MKQAPTEKLKWHQQLRETYSFTKKHVSKLGLKILAIFSGVLAIMLGIGTVSHTLVFFGILAFPVALLSTTFWFGRVAEKAAYSSLEGQLGAAASVLNALPIRRGWFTTPGVGVDKQQNLVHRVIGRPGIILVGEGARPHALIADQKKAMTRFVPGIPIHELVVGTDGVELTNLQKSVKKLPKSLRPGEVTDLRRKLDALPKTALPIPKGPMPKGGRIPRR